MTRQVTIADILHHAADVRLASTEYEWDTVMNKDKFSCVAIEEAISDLLGWEALYHGTIQNRILDGLTNMGLNTSSLNAFGRWYRTGDNAQQARYGWLKLAALMAEEQGV